MMIIFLLLPAGLASLAPASDTSTPDQARGLARSKGRYPGTASHRRWGVKSCHCVIIEAVLRLDYVIRPRLVRLFRSLDAEKLAVPAARLAPSDAACMIFASNWP
jgi:hypothetical protein